MPATDISSQTIDTWVRAIRASDRLPKPVVSFSTATEAEIGGDLLSESQNPFASAEIKDWARRTLPSTRTYRATLSSTLNVSIFGYESILSLAECEEFVRLIRVYLLALYGSETHPELPTMNIVWFPAPHIRQIPSNPTRPFVSDSSHINGGITSYYYNHRHIQIFRREEAYKVLLHELIHATRQDRRLFPTENDGILTQTIVQRYGIQSSDVVLLEFMTESLAVIYYTLYSAIRVCASSLVYQTSAISKAFSYLWKKQLDFIHLQAAKQLWLQGLTEIRPMSVYRSSLRTPLLSPPMAFRERTNVFAYYIIKSAFLATYTPYQILRMRPIQKVSEMMAFMENTAWKKTMKRLIATMERLVKENPELGQTMRMNVLEPFFG